MKIFWTLKAFKKISFGTNNFRTLFTIHLSLIRNKQKLKQGNSTYTKRHNLTSSAGMMWTYWHLGHKWSGREREKESWSLTIKRFKGGKVKIQLSKYYNCKLKNILAKVNNYFKLAVEVVLLCHYFSDILFWGHFNLLGAFLEPKGTEVEDFK